MSLIRCHHPSVVLFSTGLPEHKPRLRRLDLGMHTLIHFLACFVYRNAKGNPRPEPRLLNHATSPWQRHKLCNPLYRDVIKPQIPANSETFWKCKVGDVGVNVVLLYKYINQIVPKKSLLPRRRRKLRLGGAERMNTTSVGVKMKIKMTTRRMHPGTSNKRRYKHPK